MSSTFENVIGRDIARTYPEHEFFKGQDSLGQEVLFNVMKVTGLELLTFDLLCSVFLHVMYTYPQKKDDLFQSPITAWYTCSIYKSCVYLVMCRTEDCI